MTPSFLALYLTAALTIAPLQATAATSWQSSIGLASEAAAEVPVQVWRTPSVIRVDEVAPVYAQANSKWPVWALEPGVDVEVFAEYYDGESWWVYVVLPGTSLSGWIQYDG